MRPLLVSLFYAVLSIAEIEARDSYLLQLQNRINSANQEIAQNGSLGETRTDAEKLLRRSEILRDQVENLITAGAGNALQTLPAIMAGKVFSPGEERESESKIFIPEEFVRASETILGLPTRIVVRSSSNSLLAIAIMMCGTIGGMIASFRNTGRLTRNSVIFGLSSGFIVFLSIKGGRHIFLLQAQGLIPQFNPYTSSFLGLIAGMFTERTFQFLGTVIDSVFNKLKKVLEE